MKRKLHLKIVTTRELSQRWNIAYDGLLRGFGKEVMVKCLMDGSIPDWEKAKLYNIYELRGRLVEFH